MLFVNNLQSLITCKNWSIFWVSTIHPLYVHMCAYKPNCWTMQYHLSFMNLFCFVASFSMREWFKCQWYLAHGLTAHIMTLSIIWCYHVILYCMTIINQTTKILKLWPLQWKGGLVLMVSGIGWHMCKLGIIKPSSHETMNISWSTTNFTSIFYLVAIFVICSKYITYLLQRGFCKSKIR